MTSRSRSEGDHGEFLFQLGGLGRDPEIKEIPPPVPFSVIEYYIHHQT